MNQSDHATICVQTLAVSDTFSILDLFQHFAHQHWAVLLDSADSQHPDSRFDIMVAQPVATLVTQGKSTSISHGETHTSSQQNPIDLLSQWQDSLFPQSKINPSELVEQLPFCCGALGYFAYDLGRRFEQLPQLAQKDSQSPDMAVGLYSWAVVRDNHSNKTYLCWHNQYPAPQANELLALLNQKPAATHFKVHGQWQAYGQSGLC